MPVRYFRVANPEICIQASDWTGFGVAHIFRLRKKATGFSATTVGGLQTQTDDTTGVFKINSSQN